MDERDRCWCSTATSTHLGVLTGDVPHQMIRADCVGEAGLSSAHAKKVMKEGAARVSKHVLVLGSCPMWHAAVMLHSCASKCDI